MSSPSEPDTHLPLRDGWQCWRPFVLRGAGVPFSHLTSLAASATIASLEQAQARKEAHQANSQALLEGWPAPASTSSAGERKRLRKARLRLREGALPGPSVPLPVSLQPLYQAAKASHEQLTQAHLAAQEAWSSEYPALCASLQSHAQTPLVRRAMLWQNRDAVTKSLSQLEALSPTQDNRKARQARLLIMRYLQRYCAKNDTIGFFGPVAWGRWSAREAPLIEPGPALVVSHTVSFEPWAIDTLAKQWSKDPAFQLDLAPRLHPLLDVHEGLLYGTAKARRRDGSRTVSPQHLAWLSRCDGQRSAREVLAEILSAPEHPFAGPEEAVNALFQLVKQGWLVWELALSWGTNVEDALVAHIEKIEQKEQRQAYQAALKPLLEAKAALWKVEQEADGLGVDGALEQLQEHFVSLTGQQATRNHGQTYGGRTLVYMDCRRDGEFVLPAQWLEEISAPLALVLQSARWFTYTIAKAYREQLGLWFEALASALKLEEVPLVSLWRKALPWLQAACPPPVATAVSGLQSGWQALLSVPDEAGQHHQVAPEALRDAVMERFAAPCPGWPSARHHAPDLMLAADALGGTGLPLFVLGELHTGLNPLCTLTMSSQHPDLSVLTSLYKQDIDEVGIAPIPQVDFARSAHDSRLAPDDFHLDTGGPWASWRGPEKVIPIGTLVAKKQEGRLIACTRDGLHSFDVIQIFERHLKTQSAVHFSPFSLEQAHAPRLSLGKLVVARERWRFPVDVLSFAFEKTTFGRFQACFAWAQEEGLPRHLFLSTPREMKPVYIDRHSPHSVDMLCHLIKQAQAPAPSVGDGSIDTTATVSVTFTEMLPGPTQLWLPDAAQGRYPSELRMVVLDPVAWSPEESLSS